MAAGDRRAQAGVTRAGVVAAALGLVAHAGLDALTMRALADRLQVKAASLYWHVRDRDELVELLASALLDAVQPSSTQGGWRSEALGICSALEQVVTRRDAARVILEVPGALERSRAQASLSRILSEAGLSQAEANETATMMLAWVLVASLWQPEEQPRESDRSVLLAVDTGSRGVTLRAGSNMSGLIRSANDPSASAPAVIRGDRVTVRRLRGVRQGELELNPSIPWRFKVQAPTWNTVLDLPGLDVRGIHIDSGATRVECILPPPRGVVLIDISSGVVGVRLRRPAGAAVVAEVNTGALQLRLDGRSIGATTADVHWQSSEGAAAGDHYVVRIHSGTMRVTLDEDASIGVGPGIDVSVVPRAGLRAALEVVLDGVAARAAS
jgi:TetR/AcrR family transcriptional regulator, tetracycline repressor protein